MKLKKANEDKTQEIKLWQNFKNSNSDTTKIVRKTQIVTKLKLWQKSKTQNVTTLKRWQNSKIQIVTTQKLKLWQNSKTQIVTKLNNSNSNKTKKTQIGSKLKTQIMTKLKNSNCDKTWILKNPEWWRQKKLKGSFSKTLQCLLLRPKRFLIRFD